VIVTGGAGFIGSHIVDALVARGDEVVVLDDLSHGRRENVSPSAELVVGDIRDAEAVAEVFGEARPQACLHLAAQADVRVSVTRPDFDAEVNVLGTIRLLEAAREHGTRIVFASTGGAVYGECAEPATESSHRAPLAQYGTSKLAGEEYLATYNRLYGSEHSALRFGNVYGPRQDPHGEAGVVAIFLGKLARGEAPHIFGDGSQQRDYVYVRDVAAATLAALERPGRLQHRHGRRHFRARPLRRLPARVRRRRRAGLRPAPARRAAAERPRHEPRRAGAGLLGADVL